MMTALSSLDGVLMARLNGDTLVVTYDDDKVRFHEVVNALLSVGFGAYLRRMVLMLARHPVSDLRQWDAVAERIRNGLDGAVSVEYDAVIRRLIITLDPSLGEDEIIKTLGRLGIPQFKVVSDEVAQVTLSMS
jgi:hypothetical protein